MTSDTRTVEWVGGPHDGKTFEIPSAALIVQGAHLARNEPMQWACPLHKTPEGWRVYWDEREPLE